MWLYSIADLLTLSWSCYPVADLVTLFLNLRPCCQPSDPRAHHSTSVVDLMTLDLIMLYCCLLIQLLTLWPSIKYLCFWLCDPLPYLLTHLLSLWPCCCLSDPVTYLVTRLLTFWRCCDFVTLFLTLWPCCWHSNPIADLVTLLLTFWPCCWPSDPLADLATLLLT